MIRNRSHMRDRCDLCIDDCYFLDCIEMNKYSDYVHTYYKTHRYFLVFNISVYLTFLIYSTRVVSFILRHLLVLNDDTGSDS